MQTKEIDDLKKSRFYGLFNKHPWLLDLCALLYRTSGVWREFYEINIKPFNRQKQ